MQKVTHAMKKRSDGDEKKEKDHPKRKKERSIGMNLHKMIQIEADRLEKEVRELEKRLEKAPKGSLRCHKNG